MKKGSTKTKSSLLPPKDPAKFREEQIEQLTYELQSQCAILNIITHCDIMTNGMPDNVEDLKQSLKTLTDAIWHIGSQIVHTSHQLDYIVNFED